MIAPATIRTNPEASQRFGLGMLLAYDYGVIHVAEHPL